MNYAAIIKKAFHFTKSHPVLWLFGLFLSGGTLISLIQTVDNWRKFIYGPKDLIVMLVIFFLWLVLLTWIWVVFIIFVCDSLGIQRLRHGDNIEVSLKKIILESGKVILPVSVFSLFIFAVGLLAYLSVKQSWYFSAVVDMQAVVSILMLCAVLSLLGFFHIIGTFFIVLYHRKVWTALGLALDLLIKRWQRILVGMVISLGSFIFFLGISYFLLLIVRVVTISLLSYSKISSLAGFYLLVFIGPLFYFIWAALASAFFNTALILFFDELVKPPYDPLAKKVQNIPLVPAEGVSAMDKFTHFS